MNFRPGLPVSITEEHDPALIASRFINHFKVSSSIRSKVQVVDAGETATELTVRFSAKDEATVIKTMVRGKSPGHDSLSIEHMQHAKVQLPRVFYTFFTLYIGHCHLPEVLKTIVVPIQKNKTGDTLDLDSYMPISVAPVIGCWIVRLISIWKIASNCTTHNSGLDPDCPQKVQFCHSSIL